jgi:hypothetical protein
VTQEDIATLIEAAKMQGSTKIEDPSGGTRVTTHVYGDGHAERAVAEHMTAKRLLSAADELVP